LIQKIQGWALRYPDEFFLSGIEILTLAIMAVAVLFLTNSSSSPSLVLFSVLILLLTSSESAVQVMNYLVTALLPSEILPKLNFSEGVPDECVTMVAVPSLLLNEIRCGAWVENLEVRFSWESRSQTFTSHWLTDLPDTREPAREDSPLISTCVRI